nr:single-stranded DNA-binding protein [Corynebacterium amycolatum]
MRNPNFVVIGGNLGGDARYAVTQSGKEVVSFSVGHSRSQFNEQSNSWEEVNTTWWNVTYWGSDREDLQRLSEQLTRGRRVVVTGRAELRPYTTKDGRDGVSLDLLASTVSLVP